jgi:hypothetical protein
MSLALSLNSDIGLDMTLLRLLPPPPPPRLLLLRWPFDSSSWIGRGRPPSGEVGEMGVRTVRVCEGIGLGRKIEQHESWTSLFALSTGVPLFSSDGDGFSWR